MTKKEILTGLGRISPKRPIRRELLQAAEDNWESLKPDYKKALEQVVAGQADTAAINIAFVGMHYAAQFQWTEIFPLLMELSHKPEAFLERVLGDSTTEEFKDILYYTCDGNRASLMDLLYDAQAYDFMRSNVLDILGQFWLDGTLPEAEWKKTLVDVTERVDPKSEVYTEAIGDMAKCHFREFIPLIRSGIGDGKGDLQLFGDFAEIMDLMYGDEKPEFIRKPFDTIKELGRWYDITGMQTMHSYTESAEFNKKFQEAMRKIGQDPPRRIAKHIGRNDPCPCGSGKKYKNCCMRKDEEAAARKNEIEPYETKLRFLSEYPKLSFDPVTGQQAETFERKEGMTYLEDLYDRDTILADVLIYLGMLHTPLIGAGRGTNPEARQTAYLKKAWDAFTALYEKGGYTSLEDYDRDHMIHYPSTDWIEKLLEDLKKTGDRRMRDRVQEFLDTKTTGLVGTPLPRRKTSSLF